MEEQVKESVGAHPKFLGIELKKQNVIARSPQGDEVTQSWRGAQ